MPASKPPAPDEPAGQPTRLVVGEDWRPDPPPPDCSCMVCEAKRGRLAELGKKDAG